jgi:CDP-paratose 2-epimerase
VVRQLEAGSRLGGEIYNVGGGRENSVSLREMTDRCRSATGREVPVGSDPGTSAVDVPFYVSDSRKAKRDLGWWPRRGVGEIVDETARWVRENEKELAPLLG